ncbi:MAG: FAD/NAD(P)-binding oxidoreductase [candidate division WOR-3 bacterium]
MKEVIIIGSGPASINCARSFRRVNRESCVRIITRDNFLYSKMVLPSVFRYSLRDSDINIKLPDDGIILEFGHEIRHIDPEKRKIFSKSKEWEYDVLFIGIGSVPRKIPFSGNKIFYASSTDEMRRLRMLVEYGAKNLVIYGFGFATLEFLDIFLSLNLRPVIIASSHYPLSQILSKDLACMLFEYIKDFGVFYFGREISFVDNSRILLSSGEVLNYDVLLVLKGTEPSNISGLDLNVDSFFRTSFPDIFAGGDAVKVRDIVRDEKRYIHLNTVAWEMGFTAGLNMAGVNIEYKGSYFRTVSKGKRIRLQMAGDLSVYDDVILNKNKDGFIAVTLKNNKISGFLTYNFDADFKKLCSFVEEGKNINKLETLT